MKHESAYPTYPAYKDSGIEWLGDVPEHWEIKRLKHCTFVRLSNVDKHTVEGEQPVFLCNYLDVYKNDKIDHSIDFMRATASNEQIKRLRLLMNDVIITKDSESPSDIGVPSIVSESIKDLVCGYHLALLRPVSVNGNFLKYFLEGYFCRACFMITANGLTRYALGRDEIASQVISLPPVLEQESVAAFLDRETVRIDTLIGKQEHLIRLLTEKRQAVISHAVTKGLDPNVPMKSSGIEWLGEVPEHWEVKRLRLIATVQTGVAKGKDNTGQQTITMPYLRVANVQDGYLDLDDISTIEIPASDLRRYSLFAGDVLMNEGGDYDKLGRGHIWNGEIVPCIHQNHVFAVRPTGVSSKWLNTITGSDYAQFYFMSRSKQSTNLASISSTNIMELPVVIPPSKEQQCIFNYLEHETAKIDKLIEKAKQSIELMKERRSALISAAVTGKIDVRGVV